MSNEYNKPDVPVSEDGDFVVVSTPKYVKKTIEEHALSRNHPYATQVEPGLVTLSNETGSDSEITVATSKAVKKAYELANTANQNANNAHMGGSSLPVGVPVPWPTEIPPEGWLICNGDSFNKTRYPKLALAYPSGKLPDLRGEFIRGWDHGRNVDSGREILSLQSDLIGRHSHQITPYSANKAAGPYETHATPDTVGGGGGPLVSGITGGDETRPRNIAFNYIVRAA
ncbi:phage tail protein [Xenorhabdus bovienii]|uniref:Putative E14 prophage tail fiber protein (Modular protein) n=1 Tax=Xenorhabdus bovienii str. kraussei Becker Underwood TaxID=1398204 RepID=A0A077PQU0_XENBV|nr:phage tail protein [Xenorhabdus bovienii]CDH26640.1 putative E14 prophage; tail fiber protein (Modular protein) [Xenorhabdus bovienii str. kraussei Becker Underwood]